ncbi:MAG: hypothetical protein Q9220_004676 [cf. Caloplaca sp. 1 TL-2023]
MPANPKGKKRTSAVADDYESDGGFVANGDSDVPSRSKKAKTTARKPPTSAQNGGNESFWELTPMRRITIDEFKGQRMVNIREYYMDKSTEEMRPGKKGIALPIAQYSTLITLLPEIEAALSAAGESIPRPSYSAPSAVKATSTMDEEKDDDDGQKKENFEATSDEGD